MKITDQAFNELIDVAEMMAVEITSFIEDAEAAGSPQPDLDCVLSEWQKIKNTLYLTIAAQKVVIDNTPPLHKLLAVGQISGCQMIVPIATPTTHKGEIYYQRKALA